MEQIEFSFTKQQFEQLMDILEDDPLFVTYKSYTFMLTTTRVYINALYNKKSSIVSPIASLLFNSKTKSIKLWITNDRPGYQRHVNKLLKFIECVKV